MADSRTSVEDGSDDPVPVVLRPLAAALGTARTVEQVAQVLVTHGLPTLGACVGVVALLNEDGTEFYCPCVVGYPEQVADAWRRFSADSPVPIAEAIRRGEPVLLETLEQREAFYPPGYPLPLPRVGRALAAVPLRASGVAGGLGFTFPDDRAFGDGDRGVLGAVAALCATALGRVRRDGVGCEVLVVDDEPAVLKMLEFALRSHGFVVRSAGGGEAAVQTFTRHRQTVDVALLDVRMPDMDGPQTLAALRAIAPDLRCVFMSGHTGAYTTDQLLALGAVQVLSKPFAGIDDVLRLIRVVARR